MEWTLKELQEVKTGDEARPWLGARVIAVGLLSVLVRFGRDDSGAPMWVGHNMVTGGDNGTAIRAEGVFGAGSILRTNTGNYFRPNQILHLVSQPSEEVYAACFSRNLPVDYRNTALCASTRKGLSSMTGFLGCAVHIRNRDYYITGIGKNKKGAYRWLVEGSHIKRRTNLRKATLITGVYPKKGHCRWVRSKTISAIIRRPEDGGRARMVDNSRFTSTEMVPAAYSGRPERPYQLTFNVTGLPVRES